VVFKDARLPAHATLTALAPARKQIIINFHTSFYMFVIVQSRLWPGEWLNTKVPVVPPAVKITRANSYDQHPCGLFRRGLVQVDSTSEIRTHVHTHHFHRRRRRRGAARNPGLTAMGYIKIEARGFCGPGNGCVPATRSCVGVGVAAAVVVFQKADGSFHVDRGTRKEDDTPRMPYRAGAHSYRARCRTLQPCRNARF